MKLSLNTGAPGRALTINRTGLLHLLVVYLIWGSTYLAIAVALKAGLDGIKNKIQPPASTDKNIYHMTEAELAAEGIQSLPSDLFEAVQEMKQDPTVREALGGHIFQRYVEAKLIEWDRFRIQVHPWELDEYLEKF